MFTGLVEEVLTAGEARNVDIGRDYDEIRKVVALHADVLDDVTEPRFVEWDLWDSNVMVRDGSIVAIIDHERALYGDPLMEAGLAGTQLAYFGDSTAFMRGYGQEQLTPRERSPPAPVLPAPGGDHGDRDRLPRTHHAPPSTTRPARTSTRSCACSPSRERTGSRAVDAADARRRRPG